MKPATRAISLALALTLASGSTASAQSSLVPDRPAPEPPLESSAANGAEKAPSAVEAEPAPVTPADEAAPAGGAETAAARDSAETPDPLEAALAALRARGFAADRSRLWRPLIEAAVRAFDPQGAVILEGEAPDAPESESAEPSPPAVEAEELPKKLWLIRVRAIEPGAGERVTEQLDRAVRAGAVGIVLDLRTAGGEALADAARVAAHFAAPGAALFEYRDPAGRALERFAAPTSGRRAPSARPPTVVLIGPETRGAAEALAAALHGGPGAITAGRPAAGDPLLRETISAGNGRFLRLATRRLVLPNGETYDAFNRLTPRWPLPVNPKAPPPEPEDNGDTLDRRKPLPQEAEDRALRDRLRADGDLRAAVDLLLGLAATGGKP